MGETTRHGGRRRRGEGRLASAIKAAERRREAAKIRAQARSEFRGGAGKAGAQAIVRRARTLTGRGFVDICPSVERHLSACAGSGTVRSCGLAFEEQAVRGAWCVVGRRARRYRFVEGFARNRPPQGQGYENLWRLRRTLPMDPCAALPHLAVDR